MIRQAAAFECEVSAHWSRGPRAPSRPGSATLASVKFSRLAIRCLLPALLAASSAVADPMEVEILAGNTGGVREPSSPSADLEAAAFFATGGVLKDFNENSFDKSLIHTFEALPAGIIAGTLEIEIGIGTGWWGAGAKDDGVALLFVGPGEGFSEAWERIFGQCDVPSGPNRCPQLGEAVFTQPDAGGVLADLDPPRIGWESNSQKVFRPVFDLAALPLRGGGTVDLIPLLNQEGFLDVYVGDDTSVGFMRLTLTVDPDTIPPTVPALGTWGLALLVALLTVAALRRLGRGYIGAGRPSPSREADPPMPEAP